MLVGKCHAKPYHCRINTLCVVPMIEIKLGVLAMQYSAEFTGWAVLRYKSNVGSFLRKLAGPPVNDGVADEASIEKRS